MRFRSEKQRRKWENIQDRSTPPIRELLDELLQFRPDMAPLKVTSDPHDSVLACSTPLRCTGHGHIGCYMLSLSWIRQEIQRKRQQAQEEWEVETNRLIGAFI